MTPTLPQLDPITELNALLHHAALFPLTDLGWITVTGEDRIRWLNGMVTNSIQDLNPGQGNFNFLLNAQGRIQGTATAFALPGQILLETDGTQVDAILTLLDRFIIMDDVELTPTPRTGLSLIGPEAPTLLASLGLAVEAPYTQTTWHGSPVDLIHAHSPLLPRYELWSTPETITALQTAFYVTNTPTVTAEALEALRLLEGTPRYDMDIRNSETARDLPQETGDTAQRALHFSKGCYLGQEIVERIRSRGNVHRTLHGFRLEGELPFPSTPLISNGKPAGELTSVATIPFVAGPLHLGIGIVRREALTTPLTYPGGQAHPIPLPYALP